MKKDKGNSLDEELIKKMDGKLSNKKTGEKKAHNCANKPGLSCNCSEKKEDTLSFKDFCRVVDFYLKHCEEALEVAFYDRSRAYFGYLSADELFHDAIVEAINEFKDEALKEDQKQQIIPLNSAIKCGERCCNEEAPVDYTYKSGVEHVFSDCLELYNRKNHDYSNHGESAFDKAYKKMGAKSLWLRLNDKFTRFESLLFAEDEAQVKDEKIEDTLLDLINYAAMGLAKLKGYDK